MFQFCYLFVLYLQGHQSVTSVKLSRTVGLTLPVNFARKTGLCYNPLARVTLAVGLPYLLINRALISLVFSNARCAFIAVLFAKFMD